MTGERLASGELRPNRPLRSAILEWRERRRDRGGGGWA
jgi:hypothetical protein